VLDTVSVEIETKWCFDICLENRTQLFSRVLGSPSVIYTYTLVFFIFDWSFSPMDRFIATPCDYCGVRYSEVCKKDCKCAKCVDPVKYAAEFYGTPE
jgi:hypothetical protein